MPESPKRATSTPGDAPNAARRLSLRVVTMPKDTNQYGTIFGGVILALIDQAGFVEARRACADEGGGVHKWVTVALDRVEFKQPVHLGDVVACYTSATRKGTSSITIRVEVDAERYTTGQTVHVTEASITLVSVDKEGRPIPFRTGRTVEEPA